MKAYTKKQAAEILQVSVKTLDRVLDEGALKYFMVGKRKRISDGDLREFMERQPCQYSSQRAESTSGTTLSTRVIGFRTRQAKPQNEQRAP